ncbi:MAG: hypothetical protein HYX36_08080 [Rhizobiales bacterium]|nr:hypothetical protein [Hyphomicrobiales bacterium]
MPAQHFAADGAMIRCAQCGHSWLEGRAIEIAATPTRNLPAIIDHGFEPDHEVRRLIEASRQAQDNFAAKRAARRRRVLHWGIFAAATLAPLVVAAALPEQIVRIAPATIAVYEAMGRDINIYGLDLRRVEMQHMIVEGARVLAVKGEIANISGSDRKIPSLRFGLRDASGIEVYQWVVDAAARPLRPGESTSFVSRVASPPETARTIEIRFAHADEIGSNARHD